MLEWLSSIKNIAYLSILSISLGSILLISKKSGVNVWHTFNKVFSFVSRLFGQGMIKKEEKIKRQLAVGSLNSKSRKVKRYRFYNELIIDLGIKSMGATPYTFIYLIKLISLVLSIVLSLIAFNNLFALAVLFPIIYMAILCFLYTRANISHESRIEAIIEAENIICNSIKIGVIASIKQNINVIPKEVQMEYREFLDNVENKNVHVKQALEDLNLALGSNSDNIIKKFIMFETDEEHGFVNMFDDVVDINHIRSRLRTKRKYVIESEIIDTVIITLMILAFFVGVLILFPVIGNFYVTNIIGKIILLIDVCLIVIDYVYWTVLRAKEI